MVSELDLAYEYCQSIAKTHAKNFYYAFRTLPTPKRRAIYSAYAFGRYCDDIADGNLPLEEKRRLLSSTRRVLFNPCGTVPYNPILHALQDSSRGFHIPYSYYEDLIDGVEMDLSWTRFQTFDQLNSYCYKVASVVGLICIEIFGYKDPMAKKYAIDLGIGMQLTNILRDIKEDSERGRIYIPVEDIHFFDYSEDDLLYGVVNRQFRNLMKFQADRARRYLTSGKLLFPMLTKESRVCPEVLHNIYSTLLHRIETSEFEVFNNRIRLSHFEKFLITAKAWAMSKLASSLMSVFGPR